MNMLIRQIAVLSVLWALCEMILPDGKYQQMVRLTASLLVMAALVTSVGRWLGMPVENRPVMAEAVQRVSEESYLRTALVSAANQLENYCVRMAERAGYRAEVCVYLTMDGALDHIEIKLSNEDGALLTPKELKETLARELNAAADCIWLAAEGL